MAREIVSIWPGNWLHSNSFVFRNKEKAIFRYSVLSSGSGGNSIYIEANGSKVLLDAGLSEKKLSARMREVGICPEELDAVFLTHEHTDHCRGVGPLVRKYNIPLYATDGTMRRISNTVGRLPELNTIRADEPVQLGSLTIEPYATPHDGEETVAFVFHYEGHKLGHMTDLGKITPTVKEKLQRADVLLVESNHDVSILEAGPYPWSLKMRIKSDVGHLSNEACGDLLSSVVHSGLKQVTLLHLSETNNHPDIAMITAQQALGDSNAKLELAKQNEPMSLVSIL